MRYLVTAQEMKQYDKNTIEYLGIPGPVLMERAALAAEDFLKERFDAVKERTGFGETSCGGRLYGSGTTCGRSGESHRAMEEPVADPATFSGEDRQ